MSANDALARLRALQAADLPVHGGRTLAYVYDSGLPDIDRIGREAVAAYAGSNGLDPTAFPSLLQMENDLVGFALGLLDGPDTAVGTVTSGGTESVLLAVQAARDAHPGVAEPRMVLPATAHAAFHKALVAGCDSHWLLRLRDQLYDQSERYRRRSVSLAPKARNITKEHQDLATAVLDRNAEKATELLAAHLAVTTDILLAAEASDLPVPKTKVRA